MTLKTRENETAPVTDISALSKAAVAVIMILQRNAQHGVGFEGLQEPSEEFLSAYRELSPEFMRHQSDNSREYFSLTPKGVDVDCDPVLGGKDRRDFLAENARFSLFAPQPESAPEEGLEP